MQPVKPATAVTVYRRRQDAPAGEQRDQERLLADDKSFCVDRLGRRWDLEGCAEMVARTTTREAMSEGTINRLREHGITLAQVSAHSASGFCLYYENVIVNSGDEPHPVYPPISAINGGTPFHPKCVHVMTPFVERLATEAEKERGKIDSSLLERSPADMQRRFRQEFTERARAEGQRLREQAARGRARMERRAPATAVPAVPPTRLEVGTKLTRRYKGVTHEVEIVAQGVLYRGEVYSSLGKVAQQITGQRAISGRAFFGVADVGARKGVVTTAVRAPAVPPAPGVVVPPATDVEMTRRVTEELETLMQTKTGWNGELMTGRAGGMGGLKQWDCSIEIGGFARQRLTELTRHNAESWAPLSKQAKREMTSSFTTLVHEATHAAGTAGAITRGEYTTAAQRWLEEGLTSAASEHVAPQIFERTMGFSSGLDRDEQVDPYPLGVESPLAVRCAVDPQGRPVATG